ncbi:MAG: WYL domain-containing protein [Pedobacter sp.]|nr:MAG: WYL domain-containing protein [Pedobacter sp.]
MPVNRNALVRFRTIDNCLRNRYRKWTLEDLMEACSDSLYEYEGILKGVSRRTVQMDLQLMRSDKLGYEAPIIVTDKKYYSYEDPDYSITNIPLTDQDLGKLTEVVEILRQFKGFSHFNELNGMVQKLEDRIHTAKTKQAPVIDLEKNDNLKGLEFIDTIYQSIIQKRPICLTYKSFKAREETTFTFHPYFLKEYRNRWFVLGIKSKEANVLVLALDRIMTIEECFEDYIENTSLKLPDYFEHVIGVSVNPYEGPETVELFVNNTNAPYVLTKPIHHSQELVERNSNGILIRLQVQINFELIREILGFGDCVKVLKPPFLRKKIQDNLCSAAESYEKELKMYELETSITKVKRRGFSILDNIYTNKEVNKILSVINRATEDQKRFPKTDSLFAIRNLLKEIPNLRSAIFNNNLLNLVKSGFGTDYYITKAIYFDKPPKSNWAVPWHQDIPVNVTGKYEADGFSGWAEKSGNITVCPPLEYLQSAFTLRIHLDDTNELNGALKVIPKSHFHILTPEEILQVRENTESKFIKVKRGGVNILKPLILHASSKTENDKHRRVIHLEFNNKELPGEMEWNEKMSILE